VSRTDGLRVCCPRKPDWSVGHDADTVAAMACTRSGAYHGYAKLPQRLAAALEYHDRLLELADELYALNRRL